MNAHSVLQAADDAALDEAVLALLAHLEAQDYRFVTPNRGTHALVRRRADLAGADLLRDVFGWVRAFPSGALPRELEEVLLTSDLLERRDGLFRSRLRVSRVGELLFAHSAPDADKSAVFLGPDSYRYARLLRQSLAGLPPAPRALDIGVGAGVGALTLLANRFARRVVGSDVNPLALRLARLNARHAGLGLEPVLCSGLPARPDRFDLIIANPPFIAGDGGVTYRDGGDLYGAALAIEWARTGVARLAEGGRFLLYTGAPVVAGVDLVRETLATLASAQGLRLSYDEIDPDIFGTSLKLPAYHDVERIAAVGAVISA